jgi:hypothetical protein
MSETIQIPVDIEHDGLRLIVLMTFLVLSIISFLIISTVIPAQSFNLIALIGGAAVAAGLTYLIEQQLKQRWKSGRNIVIENNTIRLQRKSEADTTMINKDEPFVLRWRFKITKRTRVPKGWLMVAAALEKEDEYIAVYTLMPPDVYAEFDPNGTFTLLQKTQNNNKSDSLRLAGEQRRLHRVESVRWHEGVEMTNENFMTYVEQIERVFKR